MATNRRNYLILATLLIGCSSTDPIVKRTIVDNASFPDHEYETKGDWNYLLIPRSDIQVGQLVKLDGRNITEGPFQLSKVLALDEQSKSFAEMASQYEPALPSGDSQGEIGAHIDFRIRPFLRVKLGAGKTFNTHTKILLPFGNTLKQPAESTLRRVKMEHYNQITSRKFLSSTMTYIITDVQGGKLDIDVVDSNGAGIDISPWVPLIGDLLGLGAGKVINSTTSIHSANPIPLRFKVLPFQVESQGWVQPSSTRIQLGKDDGCADLTLENIGEGPLMWKSDCGDTHSLKCLRGANDDGALLPRRANRHRLAIYKVPFADEAKMTEKVSVIVPETEQSVPIIVAGMKSGLGCDGAAMNDPGELAFHASMVAFWSGNNEEARAKLAAAKATITEQDGFHFVAYEAALDSRQKAATSLKLSYPAIAEQVEKAVILHSQGKTWAASRVVGDFLAEVKKDSHLNDLILDAYGTQAAHKLSPTFTGMR